MTITSRRYSLLDRWVIELDKSLQTIWGNPVAQRPNPSLHNNAADNLSAVERSQSVGLMRVNHAGEVSAQALYQAQTITARSVRVRDSMRESAQEENDHLAWCQQRLHELGSQPSYLNPLWYGGSFLIGLIAGLASDAISLGFVAETERQVVNHLHDHLRRLPTNDSRSRQILTQMQEDETYHRTVAVTAGAAELPEVIKKAMGLLSKVMTNAAYWI